MDTELAAPLNTVWETPQVGKIYGKQKLISYALSKEVFLHTGTHIHTLTDLLFKCVKFKLSVYHDAPFSSSRAKPKALS